MAKHFEQQSQWCISWDNPTGPITQASGSPDWSSYITTALLTNKLTYWYHLSYAPNPPSYCALVYKGLSAKARDNWQFCVHLCKV